MKITAKDFFLNLGAIVTFYASIIALVTLLFEVINFAYPKITNAYYYFVPSISFQVATLIVAFPLFLLISWLLEKGYKDRQELKDNWMRRWLAYITLFIAGVVIAGDLVAVIYAYLDGQEITTSFILKVVTLIVVMGGVFTYFLREVRMQIASRERKIWRIASAAFILASIILGFVVIGSPRDQRAFKIDMQKVSDLQTLQWQIVNYWQQKGSLPAILAETADPMRGGYIPKDPETNGDYEYVKTGNLSFTLCATFKRESQLVGSRGASMTKPVGDVMMGPESENWQHPIGKHCFERTIDPDFYPPVKR